MGSLVEEGGKIIVESEFEEDDDTSDSVFNTSDVAPPAVLLATAGYDHSIRFWDVVTGVCTNTLQYNLSVPDLFLLTSLYIYVFLLSK